MRKQLIICLIICIIASLSMVSAENNTEPTIYVNNQPTIETLEDRNSNASFADEFLTEENQYSSTIQINNSSINNSITNIPNYENNNGTIEYNGTYEVDDIKNSSASTSDQPNILGINKKTGANLWLLGCVIIVVTIIIVLHKKD